MFVPEYTITNGMLKNIAIIEYGRAVIENTTILPNWQRQLQKEAKVGFIYNTLHLESIRADKRLIKKEVDKIRAKIPDEIKNTHNALETAINISKTRDLEENDLKLIYKELTKDTTQKVFRSNRITHKTTPEEILAQTVSLLDWYHSVDAQQTHPVIISGILIATLLEIYPFEHYNTVLANLISRISLGASGYDLNNYTHIEEHYNKSKSDYDKALYSILANDQDLTEWLEYYARIFANTISNIKDTILLLERDTKIARTTGNISLTQRQERIIEYLQDYGVLQNKEFGNLFPNISEDSVLRELKALIDKGIVIKLGKTKNSRYELR